MLVGITGFADCRVVDKMAENILNIEKNYSDSEVRFIRVLRKEDGGFTFINELYGKNQEKFEIYPVSKMLRYEKIIDNNYDRIEELENKVEELKTRIEELELDALFLLKRIKNSNNKK